MKIRLMTYNIQHGLEFLKLLNKQRVINLDNIVDVIKQEEVDIIGLNEVYNDKNNIVTVNQAKEIANKLGFEYYYFGQSITLKESIGYGNAIISKYPLYDFEIYKIPDPLLKDEDVYYETRSIISCYTVINSKRIHLLITHLGLAKSEQINGVNKLIEIIEDEPTVLMGDFNMVEDNKNILLLFSYINNTSYLVEGNISTYPSNNPSQKIDYIFTKNINVLSSKIVKKIASDHFPVVAEVEL